MLLESDSINEDWKFHRYYDVCMKSNKKGCDFLSIKWKLIL